MAKNAEESTELKYVPLIEEQQGGSNLSSEDESGSYVESVYSHDESTQSDSDPEMPMSSVESNDEDTGTLPDLANPEEDEVPPPYARSEKRSFVYKCWSKILRVLKIITVLIIIVFIFILILIEKITKHAKHLVS